MLIGFVLFLCLGVYEGLLKSGVLPQVSKAASAKIVLRVVNYTFIIATLLVLFGFGLVWRSGVNTTFPLTAYVHGEHGPQDLPLRNSGKVVMRLGLEPTSEPIGANGQAVFPAIPVNLRNQSVPVWVDSEDFETVGEVQRKLTDPSIDVTVRKKSGTVSGHIVEDKDVSLPVPGAEIRIAGVTVNAGPAGEFEVQIPGDRMRSQLDIDVSAPGYTRAHTTVVPNSNPAVIKLVRVR